VRERRVHEPAVAPARPEGDPLALEQDDLEPGLAREQRRPEPGEPSPDNDQVGLDVMLEWRTGLGRVRLAQPEGARLSIRERPQDVSSYERLALSAMSPR
jgi:hypothetical protein